MNQIIIRINLKMKIKNYNKYSLIMIKINLKINKVNFKIIIIFNKKRFFANKKFLNYLLKVL
jgi:hypothetical protein